MLDHYSKVLTDVIKVPVLSTAQFRLVSQHLTVVQAVWKQGFPEHHSDYLYTETSYIFSNGSKRSTASTPYDTTVKISGCSASTGKHCVIRSSKADDETDLLEVWSNDTMDLCINLSKLEKHGRVLSRDGQFGGLRWSPDGTKVMYIAERKLPKTVGFFEKTSETTDQWKQSEIRYGEKYKLKDNWGELLSTTYSPVVCVFNTVEKSLTVCDYLPTEVSFGQCDWLNNNEVVCVGWPSEPWRLGLIYCCQRPSRLYQIDLAGATFRVLTTHGNWAYKALRCSGSGEQVAVLRAPASGAHGQCHQLCLVEPNTCAVRTVVDVVGRAPDVSGFAGFYPKPLESVFWMTDTLLVVNSVARAGSVLFVVDTTAGCVRPVLVGPRLTSVSLYDCVGDSILFSVESPCQPPVLKTARVLHDNVSFSDVVLENVSVCGPEKPCHFFTDINWSVSLHESNLINEKYPKENWFESVLIWKGQPVDDGANLGQKLILLLHGGPHSNIEPSFLLHPAMFLLNGYAVLLVNYRGSTGYGQDYINCLPGFIGKMDVADCQQAAVETLKNQPHIVDGSLGVFVCGGSHGGFLACHLISQYPELFAAAICRNPVVQMTSQMDVTDIPDWCLFESGSIGVDQPFQYDFSRDVNTLDKASSVSVFVHAAAAKTPMLFLIGEKDLRCPPSQGKALYKYWKARKNTVKLLSYPDDSHPLKSFAAVVDGALNMLLWLQQNAPDK